MTSSKKQRERRIIEEVKVIYADFPKGQIIDHEHPDFLVKDGAQEHCVEIEDYIRGQTRKGSPKRQSEVGWGQIVLEARKKFEATHSEPLNVYFNWHENPFPRKSEIQMLATAISDLVAANIPTRLSERLEIDYSQIENTVLEEYLAALDITKIQHPKQALWYYAGAAFISPNQSEFQELIDRKNSHPASYTSACISTWLIIVAQGFPISSVVSTEGMEKLVLTSSFDHVLFYDRAEKQVVTLL